MFAVAPPLLPGMQITSSRVHSEEILVSKEGNRIAAQWLIFSILSMEYQAGLMLASINTRIR